MLQHLLYSLLHVWTCFKHCTTEQATKRLWAFNRLSCYVGSCDALCISYNSPYNSLLFGSISMTTFVQHQLYSAFNSRRIQRQK